MHHPCRLLLVLGTGSQRCTCSRCATVSCGAAMPRQHACKGNGGERRIVQRTLIRSAWRRGSPTVFVLPCHEQRLRVGRSRNRDLGAAWAGLNA
ncbi:uncharacterized protein BO95DRAFT_110383 [Aspergillus brunneoviolaceus CBS 621.78]|uniref:Uncharacterized protein n=1 Tax=Aspergillus brunneoviolaceus CBS 621.78 TaxID=1450534 RepID=A0ACD1GAV7_9EURO|nr:hypothetical protein BO95DRAFT_110383 [Aspergillus brunneoviolaceus CBS 621.78]RAH46370.1 hypothetical protein BO95DRAFT_110383 [Aspergillus brunneoviolaceus CBS 621.78]